MPNYIAAKIFDGMMEGGVCSCGLGANNVLDLIPKDCFINRSNFASTADLHDFLFSVNEAVYSQFQANMVRFISGAHIESFRAETFVNRVIGTIAQDLEISKRSALKIGRMGFSMIYRI